MTGRIDFYFDFLSPYGYFASCKIDEIAQRCGHEVNWRVYLVGAAFKETGQVPAFEQPELKRRYGLADLDRTARFHGVPFRMPSVFGTSLIPPSRAYYWIFDRDEALAKTFAKRVYRAVFVEDRDMREAEELARTLAELNLPAAEILDWIAGEDGKERFRRETDAAIARGAFGSPFFFAGDTAFWGADRLPMLEWWLKTGGERPARVRID